MHDGVATILVIWQLLLALVLTIYAGRTRHVVERTLALDTLSLVFVVVLMLVAIRRQQPGYLDVALVMGLLGFVQTVVAARLVELRRKPHE